MARMISIASRPSTRRGWRQPQAPSRAWEGFRAARYSALRQLDPCDLALPDPDDQALADLDRGFVIGHGGTVRPDGDPASVDVPARVRRALLQAKGDEEPGGRHP